MHALDSQVAGLAHGDVFLLTVVAAVLLGLRHATDPDHLTAVSALVLGSDTRGPRRAGALGAAWGLGHALALIVFGLPIVLFHGYLPTWAQQGAEAAVGVVIVVLAVRLFLRWRRRELGLDAHATRRPARSRPQAFVIGLVHGTGGSAGVGVLLLAAIPRQAEAIAALLLFAICTAISMAGMTSLLGYALGRERVLRRFAAAAPVLGAISLSFGAWYFLAALHMSASLT